jgi:hypothetical protein
LRKAKKHQAALKKAGDARKRDELRSRVKGLAKQQTHDLLKLVSAIMRTKESNILCKANKCLQGKEFS